MMHDLVRHWEARRRAVAQQALSPPHPTALTVTLAREAGTGGMAVGQAVGSRLGWPVYDHALLERIAQEMGLRTKLLESVDEKHRVTWLAEAFESFMAVPSVSESAYVQHLVKTILALGLHGECVIVGRGAGHILPPETTLRIRLIAPLSYRIAAVSQREGISKEEAAQWVKTVDRERSAFIRFHFFRDPDDDHNYDLILNAARMTTDQCADSIIEALARLKAASPGILVPASV